MNDSPIVQRPIPRRRSATRCMTAVLFQADHGAGKHGNHQHAVPGERVNACASGTATCANPVRTAQTSSWDSCGDARRRGLCAVASAHGKSFRIGLTRGAGMEAPLQGGCTTLSKSAPYLRHATWCNAPHERRCCAVWQAIASHQENACGNERDNLRHSSISTTSTYLHSDEVQRARQFDQAFAARDFKQ